MEKIKNTDDVWLRLDNAGLIYPSASSEKWNNVFRVSAYLKQNVDPKVLQQALNIVILRFPNMDVTIRRGFFWYYFQGLSEYPLVSLETEYPCRRMELNTKRHLFRVLYYKNKISFETFHSLTDGTGALCFLNSLLCCYFNLLNNNINEKELEYSYKDKPTTEELEDSFKRYADNSGTIKRATKKAYQVYGTPEQNGKLNVITLVLSTSKLHQLAKQHNATITQFLTSIYAKVLLNNQKRTVQKKRPVIISVPINLRKYFETKTLRNFSSWIDITFDYKSGDYNIDKLIELSKQQMSVINREYLLKNINTNVHTEKNIFVRIMPLFIKKIALQLSYKLFGEGSYTTVLTNLGKVSAPKGFENLVERYDCLLCKSIINAINIGVVSFGDKFSITFTGAIKEHYIERDFCHILKQYGLDIEIFTNIK